MKLKLLARRLSVSAPKMTVRRHVPWPLRVASIAMSVAVGALGAIVLYQFVFNHAPVERTSLASEVDRMAQQLNSERDEKDKLGRIANSVDIQLKLERSTAERLASQIRTLETENARLKADLAYLESLLPAGGSGGLVSIRQFQVEPDVLPNQMRYRALLTQGGRSEKTFSGTVQLLVSTIANGKTTTWTWPDEAPPEARDRMKVAFTRYQRLEGNFDVPEGVTVKSVQIRLLERGSVVRAQQTITM